MQQEDDATRAIPRMRYKASRPRALTAFTRRTHQNFPRSSDPAFRCSQAGGLPDVVDSQVLVADMSSTGAFCGANLKGVSVQPGFTDGVMHRALHVSAASEGICSRQLTTSLPQHHWPAPRCASRCVESWKRYRRARAAISKRAPCATGQTPGPPLPA